VTVIPAEPLLIPSQFDTILLWMRHRDEAWLRHDHVIRLHYTDALGNHGQWRLPYSPADDWQMLHLRVPEVVPAPVQVHRFELSIPSRVTERQTVLIDSLSIYQEVLARIPQRVNYVRPHGYAPAFSPRRDNSVQLDFPTRPLAFSPRPRVERSVSQLERMGPETYNFSYQTGDGTYVYSIQAGKGFPEIRLALNDEEPFLLWEGPALSDPSPEFRYARTSEGKLDLQYSDGVQFLLYLEGRSLVLEIRSMLERVESLDLGRLTPSGGERPGVLWIPFLRNTVEQRWPVFHVPDSSAFVSAVPDWWYSLAGDYVREPAAASSGISLGRLRYPERWRGGRNVFRERIYLTASPRLSEVIPRVATPVALHRDRIDPRTATGNLATYELMRLRPLSSRWSDQTVAREPDGEWLTHPRNDFVIKSGLLEEEGMPGLLDALPREPYSALHLPDVGALPPWRFTDHDARMVGAASFSQTWAEMGAVLQQAAAEAGTPVIAEGGGEWFWAGLVSGIQPRFTHGILELLPLLPHVAWWNVHPYSRIMGLGPLESMRLPGGEDEDESVLLDRYLALQAAYAATAAVPEIRDPALRDKAERLLETLDAAIRGAEAERIAYWHEGRFLDAGEARSEQVLNAGRLYLRLSNQTEMWVNGNLTEEWTVRIDGVSFSLPPFGFAVRGENLLLTRHPSTDSEPELARILQPGRVWLHSPEHVHEEAGLRVRGSLDLRQTENGLHLSAPDWRGEVTLLTSHFPLRRLDSITAYDRQGNEVEDLDVEQTEEALRLRSSSDVQTLNLVLDTPGFEFNPLP